MALLFTDSFDHYATADITRKWTSVGGSAAIGAVGRNSTSGLTCNGANRYVTKSFTAAATVIVGFAFKSSAITTTTGSGSFLQFYEGGTLQVYFRFNGSGFIEALRGNGTILGTSGNALSSDTYYYLEFKVKFDDTTGTIDIQLNGASTLALSGIDTNNGGTSTATSFLMGYANSGIGATPGYSFDDVYLANTSGSVNNDFLGPVRVVAVLPDGAGNSADFTPSAGSNYQNVDETSQDGDTTYNSETTPGDHDTYTFGALGVTGTVKGVQTNLMVRSDGAGAETVRPKIRIATTDYSGTTVGVTTSYADSLEIFETSPATATAWTVTEIDGAEFGIELVS